MGRVFPTSLHLLLSVKFYVIKLPLFFYNSALFCVIYHEQQEDYVPGGNKIGKKLF